MESINNYNIIEKIGEGGMSKVYLAEHKYLHKFNALKKLKLQDKIIIEKFIKEAQILYSLNHNYIVKVEDCFDFENNLYIVIEYVKGLSLDKYIKKAGRIEQHKAIEIFEKILSGVDYAHSSNVIHRDIKPSNIMIDDNENPKILDFGIAKIINTELSKNSNSTLMNVGSPAYMSPEQYKNEITDLRTDVYSLGIVFYEMITGINPYLLEDIPPVSLGYKIVHEPLPDPKIYFPEINNECREIILKCTQKNPNDRYNNCKEIIKSFENIKLSSFLNGKIEHAPHIQNDKAKIKHTRKYVVATVFILALVVGLGFLGKYIFFDKLNNIDSLPTNNFDTSKNMITADNWKYSTKNKNLNFRKIQFNSNGGWLQYRGFYVDKDFVDESGISITNNGNSWYERYKTKEDIKATPNIYDMFFIDDQTGWILEDIDVSDFYGSQNLLLKTTNGGKGWTSQLNKKTQVGYYSGGKLKIIDKIVNNDLICLYFLDTETGFVGSVGCIYKTTNSGYNWIKYEIAELSNNHWVDGLFFYNSDYGWGCSYDGIILKTINGGESWQTIFTTYKEALYQAYFINANTGWAVGYKGIILKTTDGGNKWSKQHSDAQNGLSDILFINENTGWIAGEMGTLLKTTNAGDKWEYVTIPTRANLNSISINNDNKLFIACSEGGILTLQLPNK